MGGLGTVWLVGMMGAGKSTLGPVLARRLGLRFIDSDAEVERAAGRSVAEVFAEEGEVGFRERERAVIAEVSGEEAVVALGGGAMAQAGAPERFAASGVVVYLRAREETLLARVDAGAERPLLAGAAPAERLARLRALLKERRSAYESASEIVDTDDGELPELVERIARRLEAVRAGA